jgi:hypothetical protein
MASFALLFAPDKVYFLEYSLAQNIKKNYDMKLKQEYLDVEG